MKEVRQQHGLRDHRLYTTWDNMKRRCLNEQHPSYKNYGERGIRVCEEWENDFLSFYNWSMENGYEEDLTIDRIDNNGDYTPDNCRWADRVTQSRNSRPKKNTIYVEIDGVKKPIKRWCKIYNIKYGTVMTRIHNYGWDKVDAVTKPLQGITMDGVRKTAKEWADLYGINPDTLTSRIRSGWDVKEAITKPVNKNLRR